MFLFFKVEDEILPLWVDDMQCKALTENAPKYAHGILRGVFDAVPPKGFTQGSL